MVELPEWSAQALQYQGSDGPVKVMYFQSRQQVVTNDPLDPHYAREQVVINDSLDPHDARRKEIPGVSKEKSFQASGHSDGLGAFLSGKLFDKEEDLDSKNNILQGEEYFEDKKSAVEDLKSAFHDNSTVVPIDLEGGSNLEEMYGLSYEPIFSQYGHRFYTTNPKVIEALQVYRRKIGRDGRGRGEKKREEIPKRKGDKKKDEEKKREETQKRKIDDKKQDEEKKRKERFNELCNISSPNVRRYRQCALIFGITTKFNPSGMWIVEDFFYNEEVE